jgi:2-polyprenyl-3-methyl-5-hydroxy-6-metoxy-1,4-benzoquinol methylase
MKNRNKSKVYEIYNMIMEWFDAHRNKELVMERFYLDYVLGLSPPYGTVLDVGCGTGEPIAQFFIENSYKVTGVDASEKMIEVCLKRFPQHKWLLLDMRVMRLEEQFNIVIAWHSFFHLPHEDQRATLKLLSSHVKPDGFLVFTSGPEYGEKWSDNGGYDLYHASLSEEEYRTILQSNDMDVLVHKAEDPDCGNATVWIAKKTNRVEKTH